MEQELSRIAQAAAVGDPHAVEMLIRRLGGGILNAVRKVLGASHPDLEDVSQDATIAVLRALPLFRGESRVTHYAYRVAFLTALSARRKFLVQTGATDTATTEVDDVPAATPGSPYVETLSHKRRQVVMRLLDELSEPIAEALALHYILGHTVDDIATSSGLSPHTVWSRLRLGKRALRRRLERHAGMLETVRSSE